MLDVLEDHRTTRVFEEFFRCGGGLYHSAVGGEVAAQDGKAALRHQWRVQRPDDFLVEALRTCHIAGNGLAIHGEGITMQQARSQKALHHHRQTACVVEVFHQVLARWHQVDDGGNVAPQGVPIVQREWDAHAARNGNQMDHRIGGAANGAADADGVFKSFAGENVGQADIAIDQVDNVPAGTLGQLIAARIHGGDRSVFRQAYAHGFDQTGHGGGCSHGHARARRARHAAFCLHELRQGHGACVDGLREFPDMGS